MDHDGAVHHHIKEVPLELRKSDLHERNHLNYLAAHHWSVRQYRSDRTSRGNRSDGCGRERRADAVCTCATAAATAAKVATLASGTLTLKAGVTVAVKLRMPTSASSPTLNVAGTGAKAIYTQGVRYAYWRANSTVVFTYDAPTGVWQVSRCMLIRQRWESGWGKCVSWIAIQ